MSFDVFVAYSDADRAWVEGYLFDAFEHAGVSYLHEAAFTLGTPRLAEFERAVGESAWTLLVLSPAHLADGFNAFLNILAQSHGVEQGGWPVIPLVLRPVTLPPRLGMLTALDATDPAQWESAVARLCQALNKPPPGPADRPPCPYPGMRPFTPDDAAAFFGREREVDDLVLALDHQPLLFIIGPSGSGKSSLVFAGLLPRLQRDAPDAWRVCAFRPGAEPLAALAETLGAPAPKDAAAATASASDLLATAPPARRLLLVVDQAEELFTHKLAAADGAAFATALKALAQVPDVRIVLTLRADFYPSLMNSDFWPLGAGQRIEVAVLRGDALRDALRLPAEAVGVVLEPALVERLVADAKDEPGALPLLQETMHQLWKRMRRRLIVVADYTSMGRDGQSGLAVAVAAKADATLAQLAPDAQALTRRILIRLIQFGEGRPDTRRQQRIAELRPLRDPSRGECFGETIETLADNRLLTLSGTADGADGKVDIAHEALIHGWPTLVAWRAEYRGAEQARRRLEGKVKEWQRLGGQAGGLLDAVELQEAQRWADGPEAKDMGLPDGLLGMLQASREVLEGEQRAEAHRRRRLRLLTAGIALAAGLAAVSAVAALRGGPLMQVALPDDGVCQIELPAPDLPDLPSAQHLLLAVEAVSSTRAAGGAQLAAAEQLLRKSLGGVFNTATLANPAQAAVTAIAFSPDGRWVASSGVAGTTWVWDRKDLSRPPAELDPLAPAVLEPEARSGMDPEAGAVSALAFSPPDADGGSRRLAVGLSNGTLQLWDHQKFQEGPERLGNHTNAVDAIAFSPDGRWLVTAAEDREARVWDLSGDLGLPVLLAGHTLPVDAVAFSPDGRWLATAGKDRQVLVWTTADWAAEPVVLTGPTDAIDTLDFSPNGEWLAARTRQNTAWLWHPTEWTAAPIVMGRNQPLATGLAFSPNGRWLAIRRVNDQAICLMDLAKLRSTQTEDVQGRESDPRGQPSGRADRLAFSPDNRWLAVAGRGDNALRVWDVSDAGLGSAPPPLVLRGHDAPVSALAFSPDSWLATGSGDATTRLWQVDAPVAEPAVLGGHAKAITALAFSPDGRWLASAGKDRLAQLWPIDADGAHAPHNLLGHPDSVNALAFSPDGRWLATASKDVTTTVRVWDTAQPERPWRVLEDRANTSSPTGAVDAVTFSPDGRWLASAGHDRLVRLWDLSKPEAPPLRAMQHHDWVAALAFSPDGRWLASAGYDAVVWLWDTHHANPLSASAHQRLAHDGFALALAFSSDGQWLATGDAAGTSRLWRVADFGGNPQPTPMPRPSPIPGPSSGIRININAIAFSPDNRWLAAGSADKKVYGWDIGGFDRPSAQPTVFSGHTAEISALAFDPGPIDCRDCADRLVSIGGRGDRSIRIWDPRDPAAKPVVLSGHTDVVTALAFSPDGKWLATGSEDHTVRLWRARLDDLVQIACQAAGRALTDDEWRDAMGDAPYHLTCARAP